MSGFQALLLFAGITVALSIVRALMTRNQDAAKEPDKEFADAKSGS